MNGHPFSLRWTLIGWFGAILAGVLLVFGALFYWRAGELVTSRHDALIEGRARALAGALELDPQDGWELELSEDYLRAVGETTPFAVWAADGRLLKAAGVVPPTPEDAGTREQGAWRERVVEAPGGARVLVRSSLMADRASLARLLSALLGGGVAVLGLALVGGWWLATRSLAPLRRISERAAYISGHDLSVRLDLERAPPELRELCATLNAGFARLQEAFARQTRFTGDASHELRTPLSIVKTELELALRRPRAPEEYEETLRTCLRAVERMSGIVTGLLTLARADADQAMRRDPVALDEVAGRALQTVRGAADERRLRLTAALTPVRVRGDAERLEDLLLNLLTNAVRYNRDGGEIHLAVAARDGHAIASVADTGVGIPPEARPRVFERFFRLESARSREAGGAGLGLAICKAIAEGHGGTIQVDGRPGGGTIFTLRLPLT